MSLEMWSEVKRYEDGDSLDAKTLNVPVGQLGDRTDYLYARLRALADGDSLSSVVLTNVELSVETGREPYVGNAVYLDNDKQVFALAKATMSLYDDFTAADSAFTVGILTRKDGKFGDVLVYGRLNLNPDGSGIRVSDMIESEEEFRPGRYYLSADEAGRLSQKPNGPLIYVCTIDGKKNERSGDFESGTAIVTPQFLDIGTSHVHRTAVLTARPAGDLSDDKKHVLGYGTLEAGPLHLIFGGTWTGRLDGVTYRFKVVRNENLGSGYTLNWGEGDEEGCPHMVEVPEFGAIVAVSNGLTAKLTASSDATSLNQSQKEWQALVFPEAGRGWVDHVSSDYDDEPEAKYDYVIGMDPQIANYWPPVPAKSAAIVVNGVEMDNKALLPDAPTVSFGKDTIHWFEDASERKPWPESFEHRGAYIPPALDKTEVMHWVRGFQCASGPVTSIQAREGSPIKVYGYGTDKYANTGDLEIAADFDFEVTDGGLPGFIVPKKGVDGKLVGGPVVERIKAGAGINVISQNSAYDGQGTVVIAMDDDAYRSHFSDIALENAEQAKIGMFPYIRLRGYSGYTITSPSAFTATMRVPTSLPDGKYALKLQASVFGEAGFSGASRQIACVSLAYNILPDYDVATGLGYCNLKSGLLKPDFERTVYIPFGHQEGQGIVYNGFDPVLVMTDDDNVPDEDDVVEKVLGGVVPTASEFNQQQLASGPELRPGYLVGIRISRAAGQGSDAYTSALGFINLSWSLVSAD